MRPEARSVVLVVILLLHLLFILQAPVNVTASGVPDPRFGVIEAYQAPAAATTLGAGWTRVTFPWNEIQPNGPEEWNVVPISDDALANELAQGRQVVGLLVTTPGWATDLDAGPGVPKGLHLPVDADANLWAEFVRTMVARYAGRIDHWIVWNEPDIPDTRHMSWGGSTEDFVRLLQVAYTVAKETNPNAVIHMAAVTHWWNEDWFGRFLQTLIAAPNAAANNYYFDVATMHIYFQPETVYDITTHYRDMMRGHGIRKPIWIAETNAAPSQDPSWPVPNAQFDVSLEQQAAYVVQAFSLGIAAGAERMAIYKMADTEADRQANPEPFGLVRVDGTLRPAFNAYQVATTYLAGFQGARWERRDAISLVTVDRGDRTTSVVWARSASAQTAMIPARATRALLVDVRGAAHTIYPERGYYFVDLPGATCSQGCKIGGPPYMVVERAPAAARTAPKPQSPTPQPTAKPEPETAPLPTTTPPQAAAIHPSATATPTASPTSAASRTPTVTKMPTGSNTPTTSKTPTLSPTAGATATSSPTPTLTPSAPPTSRPTPKPTATPTSPPTPAVPHSPAGNRWGILVGVLALSIISVAWAAKRSRGSPQAPRPDRRSS
jgi:hypothetical protein